MKTRLVRYGLTATLAGMLLAGAASCTTTDLVTGQDTQNMYSIEEDIQLGEGAYQETIQALKQEGIAYNKDKQKLAEIRTVLSNITAVSHAPHLPYDVILIQDETVNAMAMPGGKFLVFEGLYGEDGIVKDRDELAAVLAHEVAHVTCRHSTEEMTRHMPVNLLLAAGSLYAAIEEDEDVAAALGAAFLVYNGIWVTKYSRQDELEADRVGMMYMAKAGYDPAAAVRLWKRVHDHEGSEPAILSIFSTHPANKLRFQELAKHLPDANVMYAASKKQPASQDIAAEPRGKTAPQQTAETPPKPQSSGTGFMGGIKKEMGK